MFMSRFIHRKLEGDIYLRPVINLTWPLDMYISQVFSVDLYFKWFALHTTMCIVKESET